ncbi:MAG: hypothetical protein AAGI01_00065 [Myxococcota bacterium]
MTDFPRRTLTTRPQPLLEEVPVAPLDVMDVPARAREELMLDVIHDGDYVPARFLVDRDEQPITFDWIDADYVRERDWGACLVAERIAARLGLRAYTRVNVARVLMDFGRFPGSTPEHADHLHRFAINYPFSGRLSFAAKRALLEECYDPISRQMEEKLTDKRIKLAIHTYDQYNDSGTERPAISIITRSLSYQNTSEMPAGLFDPLFPDVLGEFTADRTLRDRLSLMLEKANIPVAHNYPYCLPEGSLEVRYQVWVYFQALRVFFESRAPETKGDGCYELVWRMLSDTNLRSAESDMFRSFIHMFRRAPQSRDEEFRRAARAYDRLCVFCASDEGQRFVRRYRFSPRRVSSLGLEVRKDLLCEFDASGDPTRVRWGNVQRIGDVLARALQIYMCEDRPELEPTIDHQDDFERHAAWYRDVDLS